MDKLIIQYPKSIPSVLCEEIIYKFEETKQETSNKLEIPKQNEEWEKIERIIYKELVNKIYDYKKKILININKNETEKLLLLLNKKMIINSFMIQKYKAENIETIIDNYNRVNNRCNVLTYVFFLNTVSDSGEIIFTNGTVIKPENGKLVLFPDNLNYLFKCKLSINDQYIISGQLYNI